MNRRRERRVYRGIDRGRYRQGKNLRNKETLRLCEVARDGQARPGRTRRNKARENQNKQRPSTLLQIKLRREKQMKQVDAWAGRREGWEGRQGGMGGSGVSGCQLGLPHSAP